jgi:Uma2 family endonuclease
MNAPFKPATAFTDAEFERLARSGGFGDTRAELRRGMIVKRMSPQHVPHGRVKRLLAEALKASIDKAGLGWVVDQEVSTALAPGFQPLPDIIVWDPAAAPANITGPIPGAAVRLVVEVSESTLKDDLGAKREEYAEAATPEYWVADVNAQRLFLHAAASGDAFSTITEAPFGATLAWLTQPTLVTDTAALR